MVLPLGVFFLGGVGVASFDGSDEGLGAGLGSAFSGVFAGSAEPSQAGANTLKATHARHTLRTAAL
mgnify:CR=1 FL=1